jgi:hypothetical protein
VPSDEKLREAASRFRHAIDAAVHDLPSEMHSFPLGQCGTVARLLATYLEDAGLGTFAYVTGRRIDPAEPEEEGWSHAWLEQNDLIIDVTADQFPEQHDQPIIVTRDRAWHNTFDQDVERRACASFRLAPTHIDEEAYRVIIAALAVERR